MPARDVSQLCLELTFCADLDELKVLFPGGYDIHGQVSNDVPDCLSASRALLAQLNTALGPLGPLLNTVNVCIDLFKCVQAIPAALGPPPDPTKLIKAITQAEADIDKLLGLVPTLSVPQLIRSAIGALVQMLTGLRNQLANLVTIENGFAVIEDRISNLSQLAGGAGTFASSQLSASLGCARANLVVQVQALTKGLAPLNALILLVNNLASLAGLSAVLPPIDDLAVQSLSVNLPPLDAAITALKAIQQAIPV